MRTARQSKKVLLSVLFWSVIVAGLLSTIFWLPQTTGRYFPFQVFIVQSGSMEPSIMTGDLILVRAQPQYQLNQVVTFSDDAQRIVTHRIVEVTEKNQEYVYVTKGDANRSIDIELVSSEQVIGKVELTIPKLGYLASFAKSRLGMFLLIVLPACVIIVDELKQVIRQT